MNPPTALNALLVASAAFEPTEFVAATSEFVGATGLINTFPVPLNTFKSPSLEAADPINVFVVLSTVNSSDVDQQTACLRNRR